MSNCVLPEYISDVLPADSMIIEKMRGRLLNLFFSYGYELVQPPLVEFLDSLLMDGTPNFDLDIFKLVDQLSGKLMGIRKDFKPQIARIDSNFFSEKGISRLCHAGSVLYARTCDMQSTREPYRVGADIFGYHGIEADIEIHQLVLAALNCLDIRRACFDLSHTGIVTSLLASSGLSFDHQNSLLLALSTKNLEKVIDLTEGIDEPLRLAIRHILDLSGDISILDKARKVLPMKNCDFDAIDELEILAKYFLSKAPETFTLSIDLAPSNNFKNQCGPFFSVYVDGFPNVLITGGRYDPKRMGLKHARQATGFTLDIKELVKIFPNRCEHNTVIVAPGVFSEKDKFFSSFPDAKQVLEKLFLKIEELRKVGEIVIYRFPDQKNDFFSSNFLCDRHLVYKHNQWIVEKLG